MKLKSGRAAHDQPTHRDEYIAGKKREKGGGGKKEGKNLMSGNQNYRVRFSMGGQRKDKEGTSQSRKNRNSREGRNKQGVVSFCAKVER